MKYYILPLAILLSIVACKNNTDENSDIVELDTFEFKYDMNERINDIRLMNQHTLIKQEGNTFSRIGNENSYSFGIEFDGSKLNNTSKTPYIFATLRKDSINTKTALVATCLLKDSVIYWEAIDIDSNFISSPKEWTGFNYNGFNLPEDLSNEAKVSFFFWSIDSTNLDVDNFEVKF